MTTKEIYALFVKHPFLTTDTRKCIPGSLFIALKGETFNGNTFAQKAIQEGCSYAFVDEPEYADNQRIFFVEKGGLKTLQDLANFHRRQFTIPVLAITGTNGKTTTKELIASVLSKGHKVLYTLGNLNNHIGVPLTLLRLTGEHTIAVIEMGANHLGEIAALCTIAEPTFGLITNVGKAHLEGFGSFEGVKRTKGELYDYLKSNNGKIFLQGDNVHLSEMTNGNECMRYGKGENNLIIGSVVSCDPYLTFKWQVRGGKYVYTVQTKLTGSYNLDNILAAIAVGRHFGITPADSNKAISEYVPTNNRSQVMQTTRNTLIVDAYNANPASMTVALENFRDLQMPSKVLILGDMRELGVDSDDEHQKVALLAEQSHAEQIILVGPSFGATNSNASKFASADTLKDWLKEHPLEGKTILIKGSNSMRMESLVDTL